MYIIILLTVLLSQPTFSIILTDEMKEQYDSDPLLVCQIKFEEFTQARDRVPFGVLPFSTSLKLQLDLCEDVVQCYANGSGPTKEGMINMVKPVCDSLKLLGSPFEECSNKIRESQSNTTDCFNWLYTGKSQLSRSGLCDEFKKREDCIQKEVEKTCSTEASKNFQQNIGFIKLLMACES